MPFWTAAWSSWSTASLDLPLVGEAGEERHRLALEEAEGGRDGGLAEGLDEEGLEGLEQLGLSR